MNSDENVSTEHLVDREHNVNIHTRNITSLLFNLLYRVRIFIVMRLPANNYLIKHDLMSFYPQTMTHVRIKVDRV